MMLTPRCTRASGAMRMSAPSTAEKSSSRSAGSSSQRPASVTMCPPGLGRLVGARPDGQAYPAGGHAGEGEALGDLPRPVVGGGGEQDTRPGGVLAVEALQLGIEPARPQEPGELPGGVGAGRPVEARRP